MVNMVVEFVLVGVALGVHLYHKKVQEDLWVKIRYAEKRADYWEKEFDQIRSKMMHLPEEFVAAKAEKEQYRDLVYSYKKLTNELEQIAKKAVDKNQHKVDLRQVEPTHRS
jgi:hypothetical protein